MSWEGSSNIAIVFTIDTADGIAKDLLKAGLLEGRELVVGM